jgi:hypothetical protein
MPKRSNARQRLVAMLREHWAAPGVIVTESKMLPDAAIPGVEREVDVVVEGPFEGELLVMSIEVVDWKRRAGLPWVEQQIEKHARLTTNLLVLVSWSGFTSNALDKVESMGGRVIAAPPEALLTDEEEEQRGVPSLYLERFQLSARDVRLFVNKPDGAETWFNALEDHKLFDANHEFIGTVKELVDSLLNREAVTHKIGEMVHETSDRDSLTHFELANVDLGPARLTAYYETDDEWHNVEKIYIAGEFKFDRSPLAFKLYKLMGKAFGTADASIFGQEIVFAATTSEVDPSQVKISWRPTT